MITFPNAKINLGLHILGKREDGYHDLESCFYPVPLFDSLEIIPAQKFAFHQYGLTIPGEPSANLCLKAHEMLSSNYSLEPVEIHLLKAIPTGGGLGGGSADGAFTLMMLNELFELGLTSDELQSYALKLGSDCPFFINNRPIIATGRGEVFEQISLDLQGHFLAVNNPGIHISTGEAFAQAVPRERDTQLSKLVTQPIGSWKEVVFNDFEKSISEKHPEIRKIKDEMYAAGALYAAMTGTGSTVYGIFNEPPKLGSGQILEL